MIDLKSNAKNLVTDLVSNQRSAIDIDALRDAVSDGAHQAAEDACTYYHDCEDIIRDYERDPRADTESADKASDYKRAMAAYAYHIARSIVEAEASALVDELEEARDALDSIVNDPTNRRMPAELIDPSAFRLSPDCPHGWAAHDYENNAGACFWISRQLDGCNAVAIPAAGVWLSYTWE